MNRLLRFRVPLGFLLALWYFWIARPTSTLSLTVGGGLVILGCALRSWAAGYLLKGKRVAVGGPYAYIRNPLYAGSFLIGCGFVAALAEQSSPMYWSGPIPPPEPSVVQVLRSYPPSATLFAGVFLAGFFTLYRAKTLAEEEELSRSLGAEYADYAAKVPAILPWRGKVRGLGSQSFSSELYRRNEEYQCILGSAAALAVLAVRLHFGF